MPQEIRISKDLDRKINDSARSYLLDGRRRGADKLPDFRTMISGVMDDGTAISVMVKIIPNPINPRLSTDWKVVCEDKVWEIPPEELERSKLLDGSGG